MNRKYASALLILLVLAGSCRPVEAKLAPVRIVRLPGASFQERLAAKELRRYIYLRTRLVAKIVEEDKRQAPNTIVVGVKGRGDLQAYLSDKALARRLGALEPQQYIIKTLGGGGTAIIVGGDPTGALYGAYRFIEHLGVRFYLHGDVVPDALLAWKMPELDETGKPLFALRGLNPWGSHPFGFDQWNADDYKNVIGQLAKMRMNFIGMHCYLTHPYTEPTVWIGTRDGFDAGGRVKASYPTRYYNTLWKGRWGPVNPKKTGDYGYGASVLFEHDAWGPDVMTGFWPTPSAPSQCNELSNRVGRQFNEAFGFARLVGVKTCLGTEAPLRKFMPNTVRDALKAKGKNPDDLKTVQELYEGVFERIKKTHPLDYYWIWTPEGWTWRGNNAGDLQQTVDDVKAAAAALKKVGSPFKLATSGWVLGPKNDRAAFDKMIPKTIAMSAISRQLGHTPVDPAFGRIEGRSKWAIPWMEGDDGVLACPQLWAGRTRKDAADALAYKCEGLMGLHWRTRVMGPNVAVLARAGWDQPWNPAPGTVLSNTLHPARPPEPPKPSAGDSALGGKMANYAGQAIKGTDQDAIYQTCRYDMRGYRLKMPNGKYRVTLKFCEPHFNSAGKRVCDVKLQGKTVLKTFDIFAKVGQFAAYDEAFENVIVADGQLKIDIINRVSMACISGIVAEGKGVVRKINCGGPVWKGYAADTKVGSGGGSRRGNVPRAMPVEEFYRAWALAAFGANAAKDAAAVFVKVDGRVPITLGGGCPSGSIRLDRRPWQQVAPAYAFVDELAALRAKVSGAGSLERFDYWLNTFLYLRALARVQCVLGQFEAAIRTVTAEKDLAARKRKAAATVLPIYKELVSEYGRAVAFRMAAVTTHGGMATIVNLQQHAKFWPVVIDSPGKRLAAALGGSLPADAMPAGPYRGPRRIIVPTVRTSLVAGESLKLKAIVLAEPPAAAVTLNRRTMGTGEFSQVALAHVARGVWTATLGAKAIGNEDVEYFISAKTRRGETLHYPVTAPQMNNTVVVVRRR